MIVVGFSSWRALRDTTTTAKAGTTEDTEDTGFLVQRALRVETHGKSWNHGGHGGHGERHGFLLQGR
jgi:hypothetical protein